ncbi:putative outer membrane usher protein FimD, partial [Escherichia coli 09BKT078844]
MPRFFARHAATLFFPMALILYDFAAYLSTDLIQPGIINVVRDFNADVNRPGFPGECFICELRLPDHRFR